MMRRLGALLFTVVCGFGAVIACSSADSKPPAATSNSDAAGGGGEGGSDLDAMSKADTASCTDKMKGQAETDLDCGGGLCPPCTINKACMADSDCESGLTCTASKICASCSNGKKDGAETDLDCGGNACTTCGIGKSCSADSDCASKRCGPAKTCACPENMVNVSLGGGQGAFCIDAAEVTKGQYLKFVSTDQNPLTFQTGACVTANPKFVPADAWPPNVDPLYQGASTKAFQMGLPVHYVNWCDAVAYCKWASKQLCGKLDGTSLVPTEANDKSKSAWYNACTAQGTNVYPYNTTTFIAGKCNGAGPPDLSAEGPNPALQKDVQSAHYGYTENNDTGVYEVATSDESGNISGYEHTACIGGSDALYQMSGNVAEWEDDCDGTGATSLCKVRGGSYAANNDANALRCDADRSVARVPADKSALADIGIRCCLF